MRIETHESQARRLIEKANEQRRTGKPGPALETLGEAERIAREGARKAHEIEVRLNDLAMAASECAAELRAAIRGRQGEGR